MNYNKQEIKRGITLHQINTNNFKTNLYAIFLATPITRENVTNFIIIYLLTNYISSVIELIINLILRIRINVWCKF